MKKRIIIIGLALLLPFCGFAQSTFKQDVWLTYYSGKSILKGKEYKPNKAPAKVPVKASVDKNGRLSILSSSNAIIEYYVCDGNDVVLTAGSYESTPSLWNDVDISDVPSGIYTLYIVVNENVYRGEIEVQ